MTKAIDQSLSQTQGGSPLSQRLSQRLRSETKALHTAAERAGVMRSLVRGELSRTAYVALLENLAEIYRALESELARHREHPALDWLDLRFFARLERIEHDIGVLGSSPERGTVVPATREYVDRVRHAGATAPTLLVAHAYVRYLGDLSGGQILAPIVARCFGGGGREVTSFYEFPLIDDLAAFKRHFREQLDRVSDGVACDRIVEEAKIAFQLHDRMFRELERSPVN